MKAVINGVTVKGTPAELAQYQQMIAPGPIAPVTPASAPAVARKPINANVKVLPRKQYETFRCIEEYGEPIKAPQVATLCGTSTAVASGRIAELHGKGLIEQYPNARTWRISAKGAQYTIIQQEG